MNTDFHDEDLRSALRHLEPPTAPDEAMLQRVWDDLPLAADPAPRRRRWWDLALAACAGAALLAGTVTVAQIAGGSGSDSGVMTSQEAMAPGLADAPTSEMAEPAPSADPASTVARDASAVIATEDVQAARDEFVSAITGLDGRVTSETVTTDGSPVTSPTSDVAYPIGGRTPGVSLSVEVPAAAYDQAISAIEPLGDIVTFSQSSVDTGTQLADGAARISALRASVARLQTLLDEADSVGSVIAVEEAIAARQSELDGLVAQQRYLQSQVSQARISVELLTPADAAALYNMEPSGWQRFLEVLANTWLWLGRALLWTSPLWMAGLLWMVWRRHTRKA
ncbi:MAG: DUF4349 domain-containing protein [Candidatus Nanopelagicales bacterium]